MHAISSDLFFVQLDGLIHHSITIYLIGKHRLGQHGFVANHRQPIEVKLKGSKFETDDRCQCQVDSHVAKGKMML